MGHKGEVQAGEVVTGRQRGDLGQLCLPDNLAMRAHEAADRRVREHVLIVGLPAEQMGDRDEGQVLRQQTGPLLEATGDDDAVVRGQDSIARDDVGLRRRVGTDLTGEGEGTEPASDGDGLVAVGVDRLRGKKPDGA